MSMISTQVFAHILCLLLCSYACEAQLRNGLISTIVPCDNEGKEVNVSLAVNNPCLRCMCKDKHVQCNKQECASLKNCYLLLDEDRNKCCNVCKGCFFNGTYIPNDYEWVDPDSPCKHLTCKSGIITISNFTCTNSCSSPSPPRPGMCCPTCPQCSLAGVALEEGQEDTHSGDPCVTCSCKNGELTCMRKTCPVLACRASKMVTRPGECCPSCVGTRKVLETPHRCVVGNRTPGSGTAFKIDECTKCTCVGTTSVCTRNNCRKEILLKAQDELPSNDRPQELAAHREINCVADGKTYQNGTEWVADGCSTCFCHNGETRCSMKKCSVTKCPLGFRLDFRDDPCCPVCVDDQSTCSVFGNGYIKSFDGRVSQFISGPCKYLLAGECDASSHVNETQFAISMSFRGKQKKRPVFSIHLSDTTINLGRYHQVRINGDSVPLPHVQLGLFSLVRESFGMVMRTNIGLRVFWDGVNLLNVTVASVVHKSDCGLCGNLNNDPEDDLRLRNGKPAADAKEWVTSWRVGSPASCKEPREATLSAKPAFAASPNKLPVGESAKSGKQKRPRRWLLFDESYDFGSDDSTEDGVAPLLIQTRDKPFAGDVLKENAVTPVKRDNGTESRALKQYAFMSPMEIASQEDSGKRFTKPRNASSGGAQKLAEDSEKTVSDEKVSHVNHSGVNGNRSGLQDFDENTHQASRRKRDALSPLLDGVQYRNTSTESDDKSENSNGSPKINADKVARAVDWNRAKRNSRLSRLDKQKQVPVEGDLSADLAKFAKKSSLKKSKAIQKPPVTRMSEKVFDGASSVRGHLKPKVPMCSTWSKYFRVISKCNEIGSYSYSQCHKKLKPSRYLKTCIRSACVCDTVDCEFTSPCDSVQIYSAECKKLSLAKNTVKLFCQSAHLSAAHH